MSSYKLTPGHTFNIRSKKWFPVNFTETAAWTHMQFVLFLSVVLVFCQRILQGISPEIRFKLAASFLCNHPSESNKTAELWTEARCGQTGHRHPTWREGVGPTTSFSLLHSPRWVGPGFHCWLSPAGQDLPHFSCCPAPPLPCAGQQQVHPGHETHTMATA